MICPQCASEYRPGFTECPDCRVPLISSADPVPENSRDDWVVLAEHVMNTANLPLDGTCIELLALESELKAQGVEAVFRPFRPGEGGSFAEAHDQPLRLLVHESDLETAHAIAAELAPESESE